MDNPLNPPTQPRDLHDTLFEWQKELMSLHHLYEDLSVRQTASREDLQKVSMLVDKIFNDLYVSNGKESLKSQMKGIDLRLTQFIHDTNAERLKRENLDAETKRKADDWTSWLIKEAVRYLIPFLLFYLANIVITTP